MFIFFLLVGNYSFEDLGEEGSGCFVVFFSLVFCLLVFRRREVRVVGVNCKNFFNWFFFLGLCFVLVGLVSLRLLLLVVRREVGIFV